MFRVGMKVVCVDDGRYPGQWHDPNLDGLTKGRVYTIRQVGLVCWLDGSEGVRLQEIFRDPVDEDMPYFARRFRPVTSPKQEVSFTTGAPVDSERWDNRVQGSPQKAVTALQS